jgi:hypothetical protein
VPVHEQTSSVETVNSLYDELTDSASEKRIAKFPNPKKTDVILRRQGERTEQRIAERNNVEHFSSGSDQIKERISGKVMRSLFHVFPAKKKKM